MSGKEPAVVLVKALLKRASMVAAVILLGAFGLAGHAWASEIHHLQNIGKRVCSFI